MSIMIPLFERRKHRRFIVSGRVRMVSGFDSGLGNLVNLGEGGILMRTRALFPEGTKATFQVQPSACPIEIEIEGEVVGVKDDIMAVRFLEKRPEVSACVQWLANENCPWTGAVAIETPEISRSVQAISPDRPDQVHTELETASDLVFQSA